MQLASEAVAWTASGYPERQPTARLHYVGDAVGMVCDLSFVNKYSVVSYSMFNVCRVCLHGHFIWYEDIRCETYRLAVNEVYSSLDPYGET